MTRVRGDTIGVHGWYTTVSRTKSFQGGRIFSVTKGLQVTRSRSWVPVGSSGDLWSWQAQTRIEISSCRVTSSASEFGAKSGPKLVPLGEI